jgi:hypothetical protein
MMDMSKTRKRLVMMFGLALILSSQAFGAGIIMKIPFNGLDAWSGTLNPNYNGANVDAANVEFFAGSIPAPNSTTGRITPNYTTFGTTHQYDKMDQNGGAVYIRSWDGAPRTQGSKYGKSAGMAAASGAQPANQYNVVKFKTDYLADKPVNAPVITGGSESNQRVGYTSSVILKLSIAFTYSEGSPKIEATGYDVKYWVDPETEPSDTDVNRVASVSSGSFSLPDVDPKTTKAFDAGTYHFKVKAKNWYGAGPWSATKDWTTLAGGIGLGGGGSVTYALKAGINGIGLPVGGTVNVSVNGGAVTAADTLQKLVTAIGGVTAISVWDATGQKLGGATFDGSGNVTFQTPGFDLNSAPVAGSALYISVGADASVTISK